jgi:hypothetical protein
MTRLDERGEGAPPRPLDPEVMTTDRAPADTRALLSLHLRKHFGQHRPGAIRAVLLLLSQHDTAPTADARD